MSNIFKVVDDIFRLLSEIAMVVGAFGVFYAVKTFKKSEEDSRKQEQTELMNNSIEVLRIFSSNLIPQFNEFSKEAKMNYNKLIESAIQKSKEQNNEITTEEIPDILKKSYVITAKQEAGGASILNQIEQVCAYIEYELVIEDVVYPTIHKVFLDFFERNKDLLDSVTSDDVPFKNIHGVLKKWKKAGEIENIEKRQKQLDNEREKIGLS